MKTGWESWACAAWRREGSRETLEHLPVPEEGLQQGTVPHSKNFSQNAAFAKQKACGEDFQR